MEHSVPINNSAIQMVLKGKNGSNIPVNKEDSYETLKKEGDLLFDVDESMLGGRCDVKEALVVKLEEFDNKIYQLIMSNQYLTQEAEETQDKEEA